MKLTLLSLIIEGAEIEFLIDRFGIGFKPEEILVEFDEQNVSPKKVLKGFQK